VAQRKGESRDELSKLKAEKAALEQELTGRDPQKITEAIARHLKYNEAGDAILFLLPFIRSFGRSIGVLRRPEMVIVSGRASG
jgi:hypothetical protein